MPVKNKITADGYEYKSMTLTKTGGSKAVVNEDDNGVHIQVDKDKKQTWIGLTKDAAKAILKQLGFIPEDL